jgi:nucleoside-diphosphate-sugar epimerase
MPRKNILITGSAGFVGCRLSERITQGTNYAVTALVRRYFGRGVPRLARLPIQWAVADIMNPADLTHACKDMDVVVHLAYSGAEINTTGTHNVLKAAHENGVQKVIHMSTAAVHGLDPTGPVVSETAPYEKKGDVYRSSKAEAENIIRDFQTKFGLPVVILRPPLIYGPFSRPWTVRPIMDILNGGILVNGGSGTANLVYIDNLIDAILLAIEKDAADGEAIFVVDDEKPTWKDVYQRYVDMNEGHSRMHSMDAEEIEKIRKTLEPSHFERWVKAPYKIGEDVLKGIARDASYSNRLLQVPWIKFLAKDLLPGKVKDRIKGINQKKKAQPPVHSANGLPPLPTKDMVSLYSSKSTFSNAKIKRLLGFAPRVSLDRGMELTHQWLRYYRLIPG